MKLYHFPPSPNSRRVLATIYHLGLDVELATINLARGEQLQHHYLRLNPNHMIPTLVDGDFVLWESVPIMQYLCSKTDNSLWPQEARAQADVSRWLCWGLAHWNTACGIFIYERLVKKMLDTGEPDENELEKGRERFSRFATVLDHHLKRHDWLSGDHLTLADFAVASPLDLSGAAGYPMSGYDAIYDWYDRIRALPAWQQSDPSRFDMS